MTQPKPPPDQIREDALLQQLEATSDSAVQEAAQITEGLTPEEEEDRKRRARVEAHATKTKIRRAFAWFLFGVICITAAALVLGFLYYLWVWVSHVARDDATLKPLLSDTLSYVLVVLATLFVQGVLSDTDD